MKLKMTKKKLLAAILSTALVCGVGVGGTVAWLHDSAEVTNEFSLANVEGSIDEEKPTPDDNVKKDIRIENTSDVKAYVRVALSVSWTDGTNIANVSAEDTYTTSSLGENWVLGTDGFYYYTLPVDPKPATYPDAHSYTGILFDEVKPMDNLPEEYKNLKLRVDVSAQLIQAEPDEAVETAWGSENNGAVSDVRADNTLVIDTVTP